MSPAGPWLSELWGFPGSLTDSVRVWASCPTISASFSCLNDQSAVVSGHLEDYMPYQLSRNIRDDSVLEFFVFSALASTLLNSQAPVLMRDCYMQTVKVFCRCLGLKGLHHLVLYGKRCFQPLVSLGQRVRSLAVRTMFVLCCHRPTGAGGRGGGCVDCHLDMSLLVPPWPRA